MAPVATRVARIIAVLQAVTGVALAVALFIHARSAQASPSCKAFCFAGVGKIVAVALIVFSLAVYLSPAVALREQPRGEWVCLTLAEVLVPVMVVVRDIDQHDWPVLSWFGLFVLSNLVAIALLLSPASVRYGWRSPAEGR